MRNYTNRKVMAAITLIMLTAAMAVVGCAGVRKEEPKQVKEEMPANSSTPTKVDEEEEEQYVLKYADENQQTSFSYYVEDEIEFHEPEVVIVDKTGKISNKQPKKVYYYWNWRVWKEAEEYMKMEEKIVQLAESVDEIDFKKVGIYLLRNEFEEQKLDAIIFLKSKSNSSTLETAEEVGKTDKTALTSRTSTSSKESNVGLKKRKNTTKDKKSSKRKKKPNNVADNPSGEDEADKKPENQKKINLSGIQVLGTVVDWDGNIHYVEVDYSTIPEGAKFVRYENNGRSKAGTQYVKLIFETTNKKFVLTETELSVKLTVNKVDYEEIPVFESKYFKYYDTEYSIYVKNAPPNVIVSYSGNGQKEKGKWPVTAYFQVDENHNPISPKTAYIIINDNGKPEDGDDKKPPKEDDTPDSTGKPGPSGSIEAADSSKGSATGRLTSLSTEQNANSKSSTSEETNIESNDSNDADKNTENTVKQQEEEKKEDEPKKVESNQQEKQKTDEVVETKKQEQTQKEESKPAAEPPKKKEESKPAAEPPKKKEESKPVAEPPKKKEEPKPAAEPPKEAEETSNSGQEE